MLIMGIKLIIIQSIMILNDNHTIRDRNERNNK